MFLQNSDSFFRLNNYNNIFILLKSSHPMKSREFQHILAAILIFTVVAGFSFALDSQWDLVAQAFFFSVIIIVINIFSKKAMAKILDSDVEHEIWLWQQYGFRHHDKLERPVSMGLILPIIFTVFSLGLIKLCTFLTYETRALKHRVAKRFGFYSFIEMTDWHNALIGAAGIISLLILSILAYFLPFSGLEYLAKLSIYYAFWNLVPFSKFDGTQILFGSRILWITLAIITSIFAIFALVTP